MDEPKRCVANACSKPLTLEQMTFAIKRCVFFCGTTELNFSNELMFMVREVNGGEVVAEAYYRTEGTSLAKYDVVQCVANSTYAGRVFTEEERSNLVTALLVANQDG